jgi:hypothetical protein
MATNLEPSSEASRTDILEWWSVFDAWSKKRERDAIARLIRTSKPHETP